MTEPNKTRAFIAVFKKDSEAYGLGCELLDTRKNEVYHIFSLYLPFNEYPNVRQVFHRIVPVILAEVPDDHVGVTFYSTAVQFRNSNELIRKNSMFAVGKTLDFKDVPFVRWSAVSLAIDAVTPERRDSITERL
jgi:hypothetical protein